MKGQTFVYRDGQFVEREKAAPELLPKELRALPGEYVTKDADDDKRVHAEDPRHIRKALVKERVHDERGIENPFLKEPEAPNVDGDANRIEQHKVDVIILRVKKAWAETQKMRIRMGQPADLGVKHLWFPRDDVREYEMRDGNPPADTQRPRRLRGINLVVDINDPTVPRSVTERLKERGVHIDGLWADLLHRALGHGDRDVDEGSL